MDAGGDVFGTLRWGLGRYAWVVVAFVLALGALVPMLLDRVPDQYEAEAQVGPTGEIGLPNLDPLPRLGTTVFNNGTVAETVRDSFEPPLPRSTRVIPERVDLVAAQDNIVYTVVGRGSTPQSAQRVANIAAAAFTEELNRYSASVGSFAIQHLAETPTQPVAKLTGAITTGIGLLAGLAGGIGTVALLLVLRRPVLDAGTAETVAGAPVLGQVRLTGGGGRIEGLPRLARRIQSRAVDVVLLAGARPTRRARRLLPSALGSVLERPVTVVAAGERTSVDFAMAPNHDAPGEIRELLVFVDPTQSQVATRPDEALTLLVVREGASQTALKRLAEHYLDDGTCGIVLVRGLGHGVRLRGRRQRSTTSQAGAPAPRPVASDDNPVAWYARD